MADVIGERKKPEQAFHVGERQERRRKFLTKGGKALGAAALAVGSIMGVSSAIEQGNQTPSDQYYDGRVEIVMSENLNVRTSPIIINTNQEEDTYGGPNEYDWQKVHEVNGVEVDGNGSFVIDKPLVAKGEDPEGPGIPGSWITFDAKTDDGDKELYVSFSATTKDYVKPIKTGSFKQITDPSDESGKGTVSVNP